MWRVVLFNVTYRAAKGAEELEWTPRTQLSLFPYKLYAHPSVDRAPPERDTMLAIAAQTDYSSSALAYVVRPWRTAQIA